MLDQNEECRRTKEGRRTTHWSKEGNGHRNRYSGTDFWPGVDISEFWQNMNSKECQVNTEIVD